jgi:transcriptional regulator of acetoin/glycerol metabolism
MTDILDADDLDVIVRPPFPNALLIGAMETVGSLLSMLLPYGRRPLTHCDHCLHGAIRQLREGTLVIWSVERLDPAAQRTLLDFVAERRDMQVISIAASDLFQRVQRGEFSEALYYRLNTVLIEMKALSTTRTSAESR